MSESTNSKPKYTTMKDIVLKDLLKERDLSIPLNEKGMFIRHDAVSKLKEWDEANNSSNGELDEDEIEKIKRTGYYRVIINDVHQDDCPYAFVQVNGQAAYYIPKNVEVNLGKEIYEVLNKAETVYMKMDQQMDGTIRYIEQKIKRFPMTVLQYPEDY